jgi:hypothetical protein
MPARDPVFPGASEKWSDAARERLAELVEPAHKLFEDYKEAEQKYRRAMQEIADRVGLPFARVAKVASAIRSKRAATTEPPPDDDWASLM